MSGNAWLAFLVIGTVIAVSFLLTLLLEWLGRWLAGPGEDGGS